MAITAYDAKFHALSKYATQLVNIEDDKIWLFFKGLNPKL